MVTMTLATIGAGSVAYLAMVAWLNGTTKRSVRLTKGYRSAGRRVTVIR